MRPKNSKCVCDNTVPRIVFFRVFLTVQHDFLRLPPAPVTTQNNLPVTVAINLTYFI